jgi:hypothetical protein
MTYLKNHIHKLLHKSMILLKKITIILGYLILFFNIYLTISKCGILCV